MDARHHQAQRLHQPRKINRRRFAFHGRIRRNDQLLDLAGLHAPQQIRDAQLLRANAAQRRDRAVQNMIQPRELPRGLNGKNVVRLFDHANYGMIPMRIAAEIAHLAVADVIADSAYA